MLQLVPPMSPSIGALVRRLDDMDRELLSGVSTSHPPPSHISLSVLPNASCLPSSHPADAITISVPLCCGSRTSGFDGMDLRCAIQPSCRRNRRSCFRHGSSIGRIEHRRRDFNRTCSTVLQVTISSLICSPSRDCCPSGSSHQSLAKSLRRWGGVITLHILAASVRPTH